MPKKILIVDDEPQIVEICRDYLKAAGYETVTAGNGLLGLSLARREKPDLIVLDLMMPEMDGFEVTREIRRENDVPIIMLTARCLLYTSPSPRDRTRSRMPSSA